MCEVLQKGREVGRRDSIVVLAEGAQDRDGNPITSQEVKHVLEERLGEDTRITVLGHVQRGGSPSAYDRIMSTRVGADAVEAVLAAGKQEEPIVIGVQGNKITRTPLSECLRDTWAVADAIKEKDFDKALNASRRQF